MLHFINKAGQNVCGISDTVRKVSAKLYTVQYVGNQAYLPGTEVNHDHQGGSSRARLLHCTTEWLTSAISPNVGNSSASFLLVGICVRANPCKNPVVF